MSNDPNDREDHELCVGPYFAFKLRLACKTQTSRKLRRLVKNYALGLGTIDPSDTMHLNQ